MPDLLTALIYSERPERLLGIIFTSLIILITLRTPFKKTYHWVFLAFAAAILLDEVLIVYAQMADTTAESLVRFNYAGFEGPQTLSTAILTSFVLLYLYPKPSGTQTLKLIAPYFYVAGNWAIRVVDPSQIFKAPIHCTGPAQCATTAGPFFATYLDPYGIELYELVFGALMLFELLRRYRWEISTLIKRQMKWLMAGIVAFSYSTVATTISRYFAQQNINTFGVSSISLPSVVCVGILLVGITRHGLYLATPVAETTLPPLGGGPPKYPLVDGSSYLARDTGRALEAFSEQVRRGRNGLGVSRTFPEDIRRTYGLQKTPMRWLSEEKKADAIPPTDLLGLSLTIKDFMVKADRPVVLLQGIEYLMRLNGPGPILRLVDGLNDINASKRGIVIIPLVPDALEKRDDALLVSETTPLPLVGVA